MAALRRSLGGKRRLLFAGASVLAALSLLGGMLAAGAPARAAQAPLVGPLAVSGSTLVDQGQASRGVTLQGVNVLAETAGPYGQGFIDPSGIATLADWGANFARLAISADQYTQSCPNEALDPTYRTELAQAVNGLTSRGIYTVLDIHTSNPNCLWSSGQTSNAVPLPGEDTAATLASLAATYGSNPLVGYEPFNEPQGCAQSTGGFGATQFRADSSEAGEVCPNDTEAQLAWNNAGTVTVKTVNIFGTAIGGQQYPTPGMASLYQTIMNNLPAGVAKPLVFLDANQWGSNRSTFESMSPPLNSASNLVEVFHPYDCQDTSSPLSSGHQSAQCRTATPEACSTTSSGVQSYMVDPATGSLRSRPVVFDEFNFPGGEDSYYAHAGTLNRNVPILVFQHGYWVNNMISAMQDDRAAGWSVLYFQNADVNDYQLPYMMLAPGIGSSSPTPWPANVNDGPAVAAMGGSHLSCESPPLGFG
ncbi:MAG TPA: hypothetical protein DCQ30_00965 [Acidimicrobiaceae bacterium]|nr:hypothetical protein [Acidimicrobiaceae bacterium]